MIKFALKLLNNLKISLPTIFVSSLTLLLLSYVGLWESTKQSTMFQTSKLATQGEIVKNSVESFLQAGQPISQYSAFKQISSTLISSDQSIDNITITDAQNTVIFSSKDLKANNKQIENYAASEVKLSTKHYNIFESANNIKIAMPLHSVFGNAGLLEISANKHTMLAQSSQLYDNVFKMLIITIIGFALFVILLEYFNFKNKGQILKISYSFCFIFISTIIVTTVFQIYEQGAQAKAKALTDSMVARLNSVLALNIDIDDISGIETTFLAYKSNNPDIREIALIQNGIWKYHTDIEKIGVQNYAQDDAFEYTIKLSNLAKQLQNQELYVSVSIPVDIVKKAILASANEFITLIVACGLISLIFINASTSVSSLLKKQEQSITSKLFNNLQIIKSAYFLIVFVHALSVSFLPTLVSELSMAQTNILASSSLPFTLYYAAFALVLIPAGQFAEKGSLKTLMLGGAFLELMGLMMIIFFDSYWSIVIARAISGAGQGFFLIGLQSYLLVVTPKNQRTQGAAVKVIGRNAGLISGTAIGALVFSFTDFQTVFIIGSSISTLAMIYMWFLIIDITEDTTKNSTQQKTQVTFATMFSNIVHALKDTEFIKSLSLIAIPGKMAITGVIMFATPLMLINNNFTASEIGQALMLYYIASIIATHYASKWVDLWDISRSILFISALIGGGSILFLGLLGAGANSVGTQTNFIVDLYSISYQLDQLIQSKQISWLFNVLIIVSIILAGISNGLLTSPVITHINKTPIAIKHGVKSTTATYTFLERGGHTIGPLAIGFMLSLTEQSQIAISYFGLFIIVCGVIFILLPNHTSPIKD